MSSDKKILISKFSDKLIYALGAANEGSAVAGILTSIVFAAFSATAVFSAGGGLAALKNLIYGLYFPGIVITAHCFVFCYLPNFLGMYLMIGYRTKKQNFLRGHLFMFYFLGVLYGIFVLAASALLMSFFLKGIFIFLDMHIAELVLSAIFSGILNLRLATTTAEKFEIKAISGHANDQ
ncbi:MAG: hypothetical protein IT560_13980 [Alphaproteobacteria bacterium]|nr:hypothetical protein [Alphaproteobacteria bacterium]